MSTFGERLRDLRKAKGLTQVQLGELAGYPQSVITRMETDPDGNPTLTTLTRLAKALEVSLDAFGDDPQPAQTVEPAPEPPPPQRAMGKRK